MSAYQYNYNGSPSPGPGPGSPGPRPPKRGPDWGAISWVIDVALIFLWPPLGLFLTIAHAVGNDLLGDLMDGLFGQVRSKTGAARKTAPKKAQKTGGQTDARFGGVRRADAGATVKTVFGWILTGFGLMAALGSEGDMWTILTAVAIVLGGGSLVWSAIRGRRKEAKFRRCFAVSGNQGVADLKKLSRTLGMKLEEVDKLYTEMVDRGYYGERAYIDHERALLVIDVEDMRDVYRREDEEKKTRETAKAAGAKEKMSEYERYVERIRQADIDIQDEVMSEKIRRMQNLTASIFAEVEAHPEKKPQIDRFMTYYLPTTLKLLESYARIEAQGVSGENMAKAKADIEGIADTLVAGYEKQLDKLYRAEAMDIAGDVSVIENMLKRDGLTGQDDFGQKTAGGH